ncbi:MAG: helix-turn-helix transcriptional regulator [Polyangiaceae bacterium]
MQGAIYQPFPTAPTARGQIWQHRPSTRRPRHFHAEPEFNLIVNGVGTFGVGERELRVEAGDLLWWTPGQDHELLRASEDFGLYVVGVTPDFSARVLGTSPHEMHRGAQVTRLAPEQLAQLLAACQAHPASLDGTVVENSVGNFWQRAHGMRNSTSSAHTLTQRSLRCVRERPGLQRSEVAELTRACPSEISRYFHRDMGMTLGSYRTRIRLLRFIQLVDSGAHTLLSASQEAGFGSYSQCHRVFLQIFDCSPRTYFSTPLRHTIENAFADTMT